MRFIALALLALTLTLALCSWGFFGHRSINRQAVFSLPSEMIGFYKRHLSDIENKAVNPDMRRYIMPEEAARHYIDLDHYGVSPFDSIPKRWKEAVLKYSEDTLKAYGIVPWHIQRVLYQLTQSFIRKDSAAIIRLSADLGHYIADAHVPLHTTENYNGQLTGQEGIHAFWESRLPELFATNYDFWVGRAFYIEQPLDYIWKIIRQSHTALDSVLVLERELNSAFPADRKYAMEWKGNVLTKVYSPEYAEAYHKALQGMVERRMRSAMVSVASCWYTAWVDAGQPELKNWPTDTTSIDSTSIWRKAFELGKILGRKEE